MDPSYVTTGNSPVVLREFLLSQVFDIGDNLIEGTKKLVVPEMSETSVYRHFAPKIGDNCI